jgi:hypothetical protein
MFCDITVLLEYSGVELHQRCGACHDLLRYLLKIYKSTKTIRRGGNNSDPCTSTVIALLYKKHSKYVSTSKITSRAITISENMFYIFNNNFFIEADFYTQ